MVATGVKVCMASMEYRPARWMMRMNRQAAGIAVPSEQFSRQITRAMAGNVFAFAVSGSAKADRILEVFRYERRRYRIELLIVDNLTKCGFAYYDYPVQKAFGEAASHFARSSQPHTAHVPHHNTATPDIQPRYH